MKGSKKVPFKGAGASTLKSSPIYNGRQSVKVKYGLDESHELPSPSSKPATSTSRKSGGVSTPASRHTSTSNGTSPGNAKIKPKTNSTISPGQGPATSKSPASANASGKSSHTIISRNVRALPRKGECEICRQPCQSHCAGCKRVFYCSKQHQQQDWSHHKLTCRPFSIPTQYSSGFPPGAAVASSSTSFNSSTKNLSCSSSGFASATNLSPELQYMISTKHIPAGSIVFTEKPLMVIANVFTQPPTSSLWCCSCLKPLPNLSDALNNNKKGTDKSFSCPICEIPLCGECYRDIGKTDTTGLSKKLLGGQGHSSEECALISDISQKIPDILSFKSGDVKCTANLMKDLTILRVLMFRTSCLWRWESLLALRNSPRYTVCCKHNVGNLEDWRSSTEYPIANHYLKNICKEKDFLLMDIINIVAVFSEVSVQNPNLLVLYENLSWLCHACTPNAESFFRQVPELDATTTSDQNSLEIVVKAVSVIGEGCKVTLNYLTNFEGGRSALALKLFQTKGHFCCDTECACYQQRTLDKSLGIRCDLVFGSGHACCGVLSPRVDAPNPNKANLGLGMFMKSKKWECDKCKKSEKYESLHSKIMQVAQELANACDRCCNINSGDEKAGKSQQSYLQLQSKLLSNLSDQHWMVWKTKLRILKSWTTFVGFGHQMLRVITSQNPIPQDLMHVVKTKMDLYGDGIYGNSNEKTGKPKMGVLDLFAKRHGKLSPKRGHLLFDAFFANFITLVEEYKKELPLPPGQSVLKRSQVAKEYSKKFVILRGILEQTVESLKITEGTMLFKATAKSMQVSKDTFEVFAKICAKVEQRPHLILSYLNDLLEVYACQDPDFVHSSLRKSQNNPSKSELIGEYDMLEFEVESVNLEEGAISFSFGATTSSTTGSTEGSSSSSYTFGAASGMPFGFSGFGSSSFGTSDVDSCSEIDDNDDDNPFIYSKTHRNDTKSRYTGNSKQSNSKSSGKSTRQTKDNQGDWNDYFWLSSDDTDDEFDIGFTSSPRSTFGCDLFNDAELEDLAEWAAMQFMMGKMNM